VFGYFHIPDIVRFSQQIVDPGEVHIFMQQDALRAIDLVECESFCAMISDDIFQGRELIVVEKRRAERYARGLRKAMLLIDVAAVCILRDVCDRLCSCRLILSIAAYSLDGPIAL
jgi:hypothetical protein